MGLTEAELNIFQHLSDAEINTAVGNGVCIEQGQAMGHTISKLWDADWFYDRLDKKTDKQDVFCLHNGKEVSVKDDPTNTDPRYKMEGESESDHRGNEVCHKRNKVRNEWMNSQDAKELLNRWHTKESEEDKELASKMRQRTRRPKGDKAKQHKEELQGKYNKHIRDERCKFRRRVKEVLTHELVESNDFTESTLDGEVCSISANIPLGLAMERKPV